MITRRVPGYLSTYRLAGMVVLLMLLAGAHGTFASSSEFIRVDGRHLADGDGRRFAVKGINLDRKSVV